MSELKSVSSLWVKEKRNRSGFAWQEGYGAFSVGAPELDKVRDDISHQVEHLSMLKRGMVEFKEEYLW